ncbi:MAG: hypothetical protein VB071_02995 [Lawsonibacter sp.]|nr:hypothetical protein [Lawsonibacter sp.]
MDFFKAQKQKQYLALTEVYSLTEQLSKAAERNDPISVKMLLSMRQESLLQTTAIDDSIREHLCSLPEADAICLGALLNGAPAKAPEEQPLSGQVALNNRLLQRTLDIDKQVSKRLGGRRSFYNKYR